MNWHSLCQRRKSPSRLDRRTIRVVMTNNNNGNSSSPSTRWEWRKVRISGSSAPAGDCAAEPLRSKASRRRDAHRPLTIVVTYRGGPESSWLIEFRGAVRRFPGHMALDDVMRAINDPWSLYDD